MFIINPYVFVGFDPDAQAFIDALGTLDATEQGAINQLVLDLKAASIWTKFYALYPFIGGTAADHKWNLIDPQDTDGAFRLTFSGTVTHDAQGITGNSVDGYADTHLNTSTVLTLNDTAVSVYVQSDINSQFDIGCIDPTDRLSYTSRFADGNAYSDQYDFTNGRLGIIGATSLGLMTASRTSSTSHVIYRNGSSVGSNATSGGALPNLTLFVMAYNNNGGGAAGFSGRTYSLASISDGLNSTEASDFYDAVQTYQTTLGRNV